MRRGPIAVPIALIVVGVGWFLTVRGVVPGVDWLWIMLLAIAGLMPMVLGGIDRFSVPFGAFLGICTFASLSRQIGWLPINQEVPLLVMAAGVVLLVCRGIPLPAPRWMDVEAAKPKS